MRLKERMSSWRLMAAAVACSLVLICPPPGSRADQGQDSAQARKNGPEIAPPASGQNERRNQYREDLVAGIRLKSHDGRLVTVPYSRHSGLQALRRGQRIYTRSMRSIDNRVREMRTNLNRIRTYQRLFR